MELVKCVTPSPPPQRPLLVMRCTRTSQAKARLNVQWPEVQNNFHYSWLLQKSWKVKAVHIPSKRLKYIYAKQNFPVTQPCFYFYNFLFPWLHYQKCLLLLAPAPTDTQLYTNKTFSGRDGSAPNKSPSRIQMYRTFKFQNLTTHKSQQLICWARW